MDVLLLQLTVFKQFFLSTTLPYSVIRGEEFGLQVTVFNYMSIQLNVSFCFYSTKKFSLCLLICLYVYCYELGKSFITTLTSDA